MADTPEPVPIDPGLLPCAPPSEWEFHTVLGAPHGCMLLPGDMGPVVVRRRVHYGPWEPVTPDHWAAPAAGQGGCDAAIDTAAQVAPYHTPDGPRLSVQEDDALWDAIALPGPQREATYTVQHERVRAVVAGMLWEARHNASAVLAEVHRVTPADREQLREQYADALNRAHLEWMRPGSDAGQQPLTGHLADAVMAVRDAELERWINHAADMEQRVIDLGQERERAEQAEAALERANRDRAELADQVSGANDENTRLERDLAQAHAAITRAQAACHSLPPEDARRILDALNPPAPEEATDA